MSAEPDALLSELSVAISRGSPVPLHHQLRQMLQDQIERGSLRPGQQIPHERQYAEDLGISVAPARQALLALVHPASVHPAPAQGQLVRPGKAIIQTTS